MIGSSWPPCPPASTAEIIAHITNFALIVAAWRFPRVRTYAIALFASDLLRLASGFVPLRRDGSAHDLCLYGIDGLLLLAPGPVLAWALRLPTLPLAGLSVFVWSIAMVDLDTGLPESSGRVYMAMLTTGHVYAMVGPFAASDVRRKLDREAAVLLGLALTGTTGAVVAGTWGDWDLVNVGNAIAHAVLGGFAFLSSRRQDGGKRRV